MGKYLYLKQFLSGKLFTYGLEMILITKSNRQIYSKKKEKNQQNEKIEWNRVSLNRKLAGPIQVNDAGNIKQCCCCCCWEKGDTTFRVPGDK